MCFRVMYITYTVQSFLDLHGFVCFQRMAKKAEERQLSPSLSVLNEKTELLNDTFSISTPI